MTSLAVVGKQAVLSEGGGGGDWVSGEMVNNWSLAYFEGKTDRVC